MAEVDTSLEELLERHEWHAKTNLLFLLPPPSSSRRTFGHATRGRRETCLFARQSISAARAFETRTRPREPTDYWYGGLGDGRWDWSHDPTCHLDSPNISISP